jgi:hypothetical protein
LGRHTEAIVAFETAVTTSKDGFRLGKALALRELLAYLVGVGDDAVAERHARRDLAAAMAEFGGKLTNEQFSKLSFSVR